MMSLLLSVLFAAVAVDPPTHRPFPQDCSKFNHTVTPDWFQDCASSPGGCFAVTAPTETLYNLGNSTYERHSGFGVQWCIDHLQGYGASPRTPTPLAPLCERVCSSCVCAVYTKVVDADGAMFFEVDDILKSPAPSCRFLMGREPIQPPGDQPEFHVSTSRAECCPRRAASYVSALPPPLSLAEPSLPIKGARLPVRWSLVHAPREGLTSRGRPPLRPASSTRRFHKSGIESEV